jgi:hypothetical protein
VQLRPLRRDERQLLARFLAGLSAESRRRRWCPATAGATTVLLPVVGVALLVVWRWWP